MTNYPKCTSDNDTFHVVYGVKRTLVHGVLAKSTPLYSRDELTWLHRNLAEQYTGGRSLCIVARYEVRLQGRRPSY